MKTPLIVDGTETWIFLEFCKKLNCNLLISLGKFFLLNSVWIAVMICLLKRTDEAGEWGEISDDQTGNGILGAVAEKRADVLNFLIICTRIDKSFSLLLHRLGSELCICGIMKAFFYLCRSQSHEPESLASLQSQGIIENFIET